MGLMTEYLARGWGVEEYRAEISRLIQAWNEFRNSYLFIYAVNMETPHEHMLLTQHDFYAIRDLLVDTQNIDRIDIYLETPGGSGNAAEEIVKFLRAHFKYISFVISGEAKSAGTIMAMGGDDILLTETGSLGPIDAQVQVGRSLVSAHDYMEWITKTRRQATKTKMLNPFDATMVAQIDPGELLGVKHHLEYAKDLVTDWLPRYKFRDWKVTESRGLPVTEKMKLNKARQIAKELSNHARWRQHGRSIKADDLESIGLRITRIDRDEPLADITYRIHTVLRLLFNLSSIVKLFATRDQRLERTRTAIKKPMHPAIGQGGAMRVDVVTFEPRCPNCGQTHRLYGKFIPDPQIDKDFLGQGYKPITEEKRLVCECHAELDLAPIVNQIEIQHHRRLLIKKGNKP